LEAFKRLKRTSVVVYINTKEVSDRQHLSPVVMGGLNALSMGRIIPRVVVSSPDQLKLYSAMSYEQTKNDKEFRRVDKEAREALKGGAQAGPKDAEDCWMLKGASSFYRGSFQSLKDDKLTIKDSKNKGIKLSLDRLSPGAQAYARAMAGSGTTGDKEVKSHPLEPWHSAKGGKAIHAKFVSLKGDKITLEKTGGKRVTFSLALLSDKSRQRAKELGE
jgi:hypothetical protein